MDTAAAPARVVLMPGGTIAWMRPWPPKDVLFIAVTLDGATIRYPITLRAE